MLLGDETLILKVQHNETIRASLWNDEMIRILQDDIGVGEALLPCPSQKPLLYTSFHNIHLSIGSLQTKKPQSATLATYGTLRMSLAFPPFDTANPSQACQLQPQLSTHQHRGDRTLHSTAQPDLRDRPQRCL
jgi:hypothetical protein